MDLIWSILIGRHFSFSAHAESEQNSDTIVQTQFLCLITGCTFFMYMQAGIDSMLIETV